MKSFSSKISEDLPILFLAVFNVLIHLLVINNLEFHRDELLYFSLGQHPDFGYATVPPMIGWIAWLMQNTFGYSLFAVRIFPALLSGVLVLLTAAIARQLGGSSYSRILAGIGIVISGFVLRTYSLYMPVHIEVLFWTIIIYLIIRYINTSSDKLLIWFGLIAGLSLLNKYLIGILFFCFLVVIPFTSNRTILRNKYFWFGILGGIIIFLPNMIWQIVKGLPVINHLSELERTQLTYVDGYSFLSDQLLMPFWASDQYIHYHKIMPICWGGRN